MQCIASILPIPTFMSNDLLHRWSPCSSNHSRDDTKGMWWDKLALSCNYSGLVSWLSWWALLSPTRKQWNIENGKDSHSSNQILSQSGIKHLKAKENQWLMLDIRQNLLSACSSNIYFCQIFLKQEQSIRL